MTNVMPIGTNFPRRINMYVPAMAYSADVNYNGETRVNFGAPPAAVATSILSAQSIAANNPLPGTDLSANAAITDPFGRNLTVVASGAATSNVTIYGWDYLGQPMVESFTLNGATPVIGNKCFRYLSAATWTLTGGTTINVGTGVKLGLPYKAIRAIYEIAAGVLAAAGTLQAASIVDPATQTTTDPRGAYTTTTAMNGSTIISAVFNMLNDVNTSNRGGLHGIQHIAA
jgi:hypothetical protein